METLFYYLLRTLIASAIFYLFFKLVLSKKRYHQYNRFVILLFFVCSLILPFFTLNIFGLFPQKMEIAASNHLNLQNLKVIENAPLQPQISIPWGEILGGIYVLGTTVLLLIFCLSLFRMFQIISSSRKNKLGKNIKLCISEKEISPFSWMNYLVLSRSDYEDANNTIIEHEMAHISYRHSLDMMVANIYTIIFWFNPFAWLLRKELQSVHEYQADEKVISAGADMKEYQLLLIRKCVGEDKFMLANNFEYNNLQKRIKMMMKFNAKKQQRGAYLFIPLVLIAVVMLFSWNKLQAQTFSDDSTSKKVTPNISVLKMGEKMVATDSSNDGGVTTAVVKKQGAMDSTETITVTSSNGGKAKKGTKVQVNSIPEDDNLKYYLDGKEISKQEFQNISPDDIKSVNVIKKSDGNEKGKIYIILKNATVVSESKTKNPEKYSVSSNDGKGTIHIKVSTDGKMDSKGLDDTAIYIDGVLSTSEELQALNPDNIKSMSVMKNPSLDLAKKYKTNKNKIIEVTTK